MYLIPLLLPAALAADPPSVDDPVNLGVKAWRDACVVVGVEDYDHLPKVEYALDDAKAAFGFCEESIGVQKWRRYMAENPSDDEMRSLISRGVARVRSRGTLWIYYAGQGATVEGMPRILGTNLQEDQLDDALTILELESMVARSRAERVVIILDAGFNSAGRDELVANHPPQGEALSFSSGEYDKVAIWVAGERGLAQKYEPAGHGLFSWLALGALRGWADGADGSTPDDKITLAEASTYVEQNTINLGRTQVPRLHGPEIIQDWVITEGSALEDGPSASDFSTWFMDDRQRRIDMAVAALEAEAAAALEEAVKQAKAGGDGVALVNEVIEEYQHATVSVTWVQPLESLAEARDLLADPEALAPEAAPETSPDESGGETGGETSEPGVVELSDDRCKDIVGMEPDALLGRFSEGRIACIEERIADPKEKQTDKDKLSRLLMANAESKGDWASWETLMARHLDMIGRSDPDLCFRYALRLSKKGVEHGELVIKWSDYALENKQNWSGEVYKKRLFALYRLKSEAAAELWRDAEQNLIADPNEENDALTNKYRGMTKDFAREWLDYARASDQKIDRALNLCVSAAGTFAACEETDY